MLWTPEAITPLLCSSDTVKTTDLEHFKAGAPVNMNNLIRFTPVIFFISHKPEQEKELC